MQYFIISLKCLLLVSGNYAILLQFKFQLTVCCTRELLTIPSRKSGRASSGEKKSRGWQRKEVEVSFFIIFKISIPVCKPIMIIWSFISSAWDKEIDIVTSLNAAKVAMLVHTASCSGIVPKDHYNKRPYTLIHCTDSLFNPNIFSENKPKTKIKSMSKIWYKTQKS